MSMKDWILLHHAIGNMNTLKQEIRDKTQLGKYYLTMLIETQEGSFDTVSVSYYNDRYGDEDDELFMLSHNSCNFTLDDIKRYAILKIDE